MEFQLYSIDEYRKSKRAEPQLRVTLRHSYYMIGSTRLVVSIDAVLPDGARFEMEREAYSISFLVGWRLRRRKRQLLKAYRAACKICEIKE